MLVFKHNKDFAIKEIVSEMELGVQKPANRKPSKVSTFRVYIKGKLAFTAMDLTSAFHYIYVKSGYDKYIEEGDFFRKE